MAKKNKPKASKMRVLCINYQGIVVDFVPADNDNMVSAIDAENGVVLCARPNVEECLVALGMSGRDGLGFLGVREF